MEARFRERNVFEEEGEGKEGKDRKSNVATINGQEEVKSTRVIVHA